MRKSVLDDYDGIAEALKKIKEEEKKSQDTSTEQSTPTSVEDSYWDYGCGLVEVAYKEQLYTPYEIMAEMVELQEYVDYLNSIPNLYNPINIGDYFFHQEKYWIYEGNCNFKEWKV